MSGESWDPAELQSGVIRIDEVGTDPGRGWPSLPSQDQGGPTARTISEWRRLFDAGGYFITGPTGKRFDVSLEPWAGRRDDTQVRIYVLFVDPTKVGTKDPLHRPPRR